MQINRRQFIRKASTSAAGLGMFTILPSHVWGAKIAPSDIINVALIGCRNHGFKILRDHLAFDDTRCAAICDVDENFLNDRAAILRKDYNQNPRLYADFRKMLEQDDIDAVIIGTPDHWHCLNFVYSAQAGKDIFIEKPLANTIAECDIMVRASHRYNRVVQVGQQQRSNPSFIEPINIIKQGGIGKLRKVNIWANFNYGIGRPIAEDGPVPAGIDFDMWLGPAPARSFNASRVHGSWRHFWDYGGGLFSDWGVHLIDMALWPENNLEAPETVLVYAAQSSEQKGMRETFDTMNVIFPGKNYVINFDMTAGVQNGPWEMLYGVSFVGDNGTIVSNRNGFTLYPEYDNNLEKYRAEAASLSGMNEAHRPHVRNFLDCIKTRETPLCTPEMGYAAALHAHIPNIAGRVGEQMLKWDKENKRFTNSDKANELITPLYRAPWELPKI